MAIRLNHTIVRVSDKRESAAFLTEILGLPAGDDVRTVPGRRAWQRRIAGFCR